MTLKGDPDFNEWENFSHEEKIQWLKMANRKYTSLWLFFSRVYPVYEYDFDFWSLKAETGQLIYESDYETSDNRWDLFLENTRKILEEYKIQRIALEELLEEVDFVKEEFFEDEGDSESGIKNSIRKYRNTNVYQCLFQ
ncbi:MAG: hypothetical protein Q8933_20735 [Bacteroidota bacterium]|nr:hypothetical protein [Bacteroidota bacterium]